jgi:hypothetical protein
MTQRLRLQNYTYANVTDLTRSAGLNQKNDGFLTSNIAGTAKIGQTEHVQLKVIRPKASAAFYQISVTGGI